MTIDHNDIIIMDGKMSLHSNIILTQIIIPNIGVK